ncbi:hypothetical protein F0919_18130 [Taibaiella lutea]|uniref:Uncharacterized protein n=1 Tax=Taibaiella lutea TaxID=2608001 RepID=A0A5M6CHY0_9BACT|nr:hypothetical protein [Taibaiella lutea]KAA5532699.1 hypothetical protein F0919_18130 [Taibaiella lutea]
MGRKITFNFYFLFALLTTFSSCKSKEENLYNNIYTDFKAAINDSNQYEIYSYALIISSDSEGFDTKQIKEANFWINRYKVDSTKDAEIKKEITFNDSVRFYKMGTWEIIRIDDQEEKCNRKQLHMLLKTKSYDTSELAFAAKYLAEHALMTIKENPECSFPKMSSAFIYKNTSDYYDGQGPVAGCSFTPSDYKGIVFINNFMLK